MRCCFSSCFLLTTGSVQLPRWSSTIESSSSETIGRPPIPTWRLGCSCGARFAYLQRPIVLLAQGSNLLEHPVCDGVHIAFAVHMTADTPSWLGASLVLHQARRCGYARVCFSQEFAFCDHWARCSHRYDGKKSALRVAPQFQALASLRWLLHLTADDDSLASQLRARSPFR